MTTNSKKLLLVGGGHGHLHILKKLQEHEFQDVSVTLLSPSRYQYYSGMFSGYVEGLYTLDDIRVDLANMAKQSKIQLVEGSAVLIDPEKQYVETDREEKLPYDVVSFDIGSLTANPAIPGVEQYALQIKPNYNLPDVFSRVRKQEKIGIVGGGASGVELSLALHAWRQNQQNHGPITIISSGNLLEKEHQRISRKIERIAQRKGIEIIKHQAVIEVTEEHIFTDKGKQIPYDALIWLTGPRAHAMFKQSGLPVDQHGYLLVEDTLQSTIYPNIFGAGDCVTLKNHQWVAKAGVYAVRQAGFLWQNLRSFLRGEELLQAYQPQTSFLSILSTGGKNGFLIYKNFAYHGHLAWKLKNKIDTEFMERYQL